MTFYSPYPQVEINGIVYTADVVNGVSITNGRSSVDEQPRASFSTITLVTYDGAYPEIAPNDRVAIKILLSDGVTTHPVFGGYVTDIKQDIRANGSIGLATNTTITAMGALARLSNKPTDPTYAKEFDGTRIHNILFDVYGDTWADVAPAVTWAGIDPTITWATYEPELGTIDRPGVYEITAFNQGVVSAQSLANTVANSALGVLWEDGEGRINYDDATHRVTNAANNGFEVIDADYIGVGGTSSSMSVNDISNDITVSYKNNQEVTGQDAASIAAYGKIARVWGTLLEKTTDAEQLRDLYLSTRTLPRRNLSAVSIPLHNPAMGDTLRDALAQVYNGKPVAIPNLPNSIYRTPFSGFVEGYTWDLAKETATLTLTLSDYGLTAIQQAWEQVSASETWATLSPILTWEMAKVVA